MRVQLTHAWSVRRDDPRDRVEQEVATFDAGTSKPHFMLDIKGWDGRFLDALVYGAMPGHTPHVGPLTVGRLSRYSPFETPQAQSDWLIYTSRAQFWRIMNVTATTKESAALVRLEALQAGHPSPRRGR